MEKTFEELIKEKARGTSFFSKDEIKELMQQVREATIAECHLIADRYYFQNSEKIIIDINSLPTDRITLTENK